jgi:hypothetical protein
MREGGKKKNRGITNVRQGKEMGKTAAVLQPDLVLVFFPSTLSQILFFLSIH